LRIFDQKCIIFNKIFDDLSYSLEYFTIIYYGRNPRIPTRQHWLERKWYIWYISMQFQNTIGRLLKYSFDICDQIIEFWKLNADLFDSSTQSISKNYVIYFCVKHLMCYLPSLYKAQHHLKTVVRGFDVFCQAIINKDNF